MKQIIIIIVIGIVGLGAGFAGGMYFANFKNKAVVADLQTKMQQEQAEAQERITGYDRMMEMLNGELQRASLEIEKLRTPAPVVAAEPVQTETAVKAVEYEKPDGPATTSTMQDTNTRSYTIQSGDSLWSIAQKQLGNGSRFNEILKLNPKITAKSNLVVGSRLKIPSK
ncbi:MAG: hypothetical protein A2Y10_06855 [Planctomycetes bacterium GWF2_41_51]|nr:MAG: hypothetical protein A2Y10_06855 [Planctomycetes bacterium GWF2_41_51]HBG28817.1 hypothetical protein [Phycisphaerales bacterium]